ncbi:MAG: 4Fe-4S dicluster domain-containing protein [Planctomycetaceae bacterium]|jgi:CRP-like cAMP-binding protein/Fe-S-cluster-containing hydrogenase component 2|nr:4Fe-4S dicluster domain-containing protein [Planctomycetaceae bacterium]MBT6487575.1 4Fe-4S dicluster domain-containing protein [Planctomycetaceae bacterium]MBT6493233.1 4Fe-4S dicluster domain-containing protein [Planctomycetaceae bacterium]
MAKTQVMLPAEMAQETAEFQPGDELLTADELQTLSLFQTLKKAPSFDKFPGTTVLRRGVPGRIIFSQGQPGSTAYYVLTSEDVLEVRKQQLRNVVERLEASGQEASDLPPNEFLTQFSERELSERELELLDEIAELHQRVDEMKAAATETKGQARRVASARLLVQLDGGQKKGGWLGRLVGSFGRRGRAAADLLPRSVPTDGPTDIDTDTMEAPMHEGDIFGEMSCINRAPRSATVTIEQDCYLLEMLRNVLDMLQRDKSFRIRMDDLYRQRVMETNVRRMELFAGLSDHEYAQLRDTIDLKVFDAGKIILEEGEPSDALYVVRSGMVKTVLHIGCRLREKDFTAAHWKELPRELAAAGAADESTLHRKVWKQLKPELRDAVAKMSAKQPLSQEFKQLLIDGLNQFVREGNLHLDRAYGKKKERIVRAIEDEQLQLTLEPFPDKADHWSELESRIFHRVLLECLFPQGMPRRIATNEPMQTLSYLGRGEILGEMGVLRNAPRSATCIAYDHPEGYHQRIPDSRTGAVPSRVELVRIPAAPFRELMNSSPKLKYQIEDVMRRRDQDSATRTKATSSGIDDSPALSAEFEELGLVQGQKLMLIDLDRCTRCNSCVEACVGAHSDGHTRLYLDGPRFENYLIPLTCRSCLDPVCMIGCPVGSINRGESGEIIIRNWCIGCEMCADQCPYGAIQMNELQNVELSQTQSNMLDPTTTIKAVTERAVVCDLCRTLPSQDPACVYACPHDAAIRVNSRQFFVESTQT